MWHPCVIHCLQIVVVLTVYLDKLLCHILDRDSPEIPIFVNQSSLQMATSSMTDRQYFHVIFHVLQLILTADTTTVNGIAITIFLASYLNDL